MKRYKKTQTLKQRLLQTRTKLLRQFMNVLIAFDTGLITSSHIKLETKRKRQKSIVKSSKSILIKAKPRSRLSVNFSVLTR